MDFLEIGKKDGASQFRMDVLTETDRNDSLLVYTARTSEHFEVPLSRISLADYIGGFVIGYLTARNAKAGGENEGTIHHAQRGG